MLIKTACAWCSEEFEAASWNAVYCSPAHRKKASRARLKQAARATPEPTEGDTHQSPPADGDLPDLNVYESTLAELTAAGLHRTSRGLALLVVARRLDQSSEETGQAVSALVLRHDRQHEATIGKTVAAEADDEVAKARARRDAARNAGAG